MLTLTTQNTLIQYTIPCMSILSTSHSQGDHTNSTEKSNSGPGGDTKPESQKI